MNGRLAIALAAVVVVLAGCGPAPSAPSAPSASSPAPATASPTPATSPTAVVSPSGSTTATPGPTSTGSPAPTASAAPTPTPPFRLASGAFAAGGSIPSTFTCDGRDVSPELAWTGVPAETKALVLVVEDPDAGGFAHWLVLDMPPGRSKLDRGAGIPASSALSQGTNDFGRMGWGGPCPPSGVHRYRFTLYALAAPLGLGGSPRAARVRSAVSGATVLGHAVLVGRYGRGG
jgi:Raf kinase inhibitor-like YbhB/YbcL family protein